MRTPAFAADLADALRRAFEEELTVEQTRKQPQISETGRQRWSLAPVWAAFLLMAVSTFFVCAGVVLWGAAWMLGLV
jgi:hypothetical protein